MVTNETKQKIIEMTETLGDGQFLHIEAPWIFAIYRDNHGVLRKYGGLFDTPPLNESMLFEELSDSEITGYTVYPDYKSFGRIIRDTFLRKEMEELMSDPKEDTNFKIIWKDAEEHFGQATATGDGFYFVGATMSDEDFYYLYWNPESDKFRYSTCVGPMEELTEEKKLPEECYQKLRTRIKDEVTDILFPNRSLSWETLY